MVCLANLDGKLYAVEENTGVERWNFPTSGSVFSSPAIADGIVYFGSWDQNLYAVNGRNGQQSCNSSPPAAASHRPPSPTAAWSPWAATTARCTPSRKLKVGTDA
ncbi:MAG: PQQ-like beta-propeller repeat protein [Chloroflexi bacterium]|nr:PQQ-like beta-propeller repeat protein [Chloroflexota bacterium]